MNRHFAAAASSILLVSACSAGGSKVDIASDGGSSSAIDAGSSQNSGTDGGSLDGTALADASTITSYGGDGPDSVTTSALQVPASNGTFTTTAYIPTGTGPFPIVILSSGFFQNGVAYAPYAHRLASWGIVTLLRDDPNISETTPNLVADVVYTVATWLAATNADSASALYGKMDLSKVGLAGHSRGGQVALLAGEGLSGKINGVFGLDPVDTMATSGDPQARTNLSSISVPVAFIGETTDSASNGCAPGADNFQVLYAAASSPAVAITAIDADHTMFEDQTQCSFCNACTAGSANPTLILSTSVRIMTAFFARELLGDAKVGAAFGGAGIADDVSAGTISLISK